MTDLIHSLILLPVQLSICTNSIFFQEIPDLVSRSEEVIVPNMVLITGGKFRLQLHEYLMLGCVPRR